jgi:hypothetical protein
MSNTRRQFLQSSAALAVSLVGTSKLVVAEASAAQAHASSAPAPAVEDHCQVPRMKFGKVEISRLVLGVNPLYGFVHYNNNFSAAVREWYTQERVVEVLHRAASFGINAFNFVNVPRSGDDWLRFVSEGGQMHLIMQMMAGDDPAKMVELYKPLAMQRRGEEIDAAFQHGTMAGEREWCKKARDLGVMVGVGTHKPEVIEMCEEQGWDVDFYAGCVYNRTRTDDEWRALLNGNLPEMTRDVYVQGDPDRMYKVMRQTPKPCFAFKILAAGRVADETVAGAFKKAYASIKPNDGVYVGVFPKYKDEIQENAQLVHSILTASIDRPAMDA